MSLHFGKSGRRGATILIFGSSGIGKTHLVSSAPDPIFLNFEPNGEDTLEKLGFDMRRVVTIDSTSDMPEFFKRIESKKESFRSLVIDSLTFFQQQKVVEMMEDPARPAKHRRDEMVWDDWDHLWIQMTLLMKKAPTLGLHLICTAQAEEKADIANNTTYWKALVQGKFQHLTEAYFSTVGFYRLARNAGQEIRRLELRPSTKWPKAKVRRTDLLPEYLDNPTIPQILSLLKVDEQTVTENTESMMEETNA